VSRVLGISAFYHDSAAALVVDGNIVAAAQEERFTRKKHDAGYPKNAIEYVVKSSGLDFADIDYVAYYEKPFLKFERLLETYVCMAPRGFRSFSMALPLWVREKLFQKVLIVDELKEVAPDVDWRPRLLFAEHHQSHAASAFYPSPFEEAAVLTMDGVGEWATTSVAVGKGSELTLLKEIHFPHSLGLLYSAFTYHAGFKVNSGEYKLMGLAPYGQPRYVQKIFDHLVDVKDDGSFRLNMDYFDYCVGLTMTNAKFDTLFGEPARKPEKLLTHFHMDMAASVQAALEDIVLKLTRSLAAETGMKKLCLAGGVALNCVANGKILRDGHFDEVWAQPASGDAGGAVGAALAASHAHLGVPRTVKAGDAMSGSYLGPSYDQTDIERALREAGAKFSVLEEGELSRHVAQKLSEGAAVGWFQGRMEYGPRALGNRSIIGDPRSPTMQKLLNLKVKYRESFRPFAPAVLREDCDEYFDLDADSPYMLLVAPVREERRRAMTAEENALFGIDKLNVPRSDIPAVTHVDYSARVQTVHQETNSRFYNLIQDFKTITGCSVLINTSFNVRGEPIVCLPQDAFRCFMGSDIDVLVVGNCLLHKEDQNSALKIDYKDTFELD
jgi:carbamoyltransferase